MGNNPLYVVTNKGQDVETAMNYMDALIKKWGLAPLVQLFEDLFTFLFQQVNSYPLFLAVKQFLDEWIDKLMAQKERGEKFLAKFF